MSASVEDNSETQSPTRRIAERPTRAGGPRRARTREHHDHHVLIDVDEDRFAWRRKIRADPRKLIVYRMAVALGGLLLVALGFLTGPLPGPGGIPLVLLGLAVWSSEFEWADKLMQR